MATIEMRVSKNKERAYKFRVFLGKDENNKQIFETTTWKPPQGLTVAKERKLAEAEAYCWEQTIKGTGLYQREAYTSALPLTQPKPLESPVETFKSFVEETWIPFKVASGILRPSTVAMYDYILRLILPKLGHLDITKIKPLDIMHYLKYLRNEHRTPQGKPVSDKTLKHHFNILRIIFNYAEKLEVIEKNPIKKVDAPKVSKKPVEALTQEEAKHFFKELANCKLEYYSYVMNQLLPLPIGVVNLYKLVFPNNAMGMDSEMSKDLNIVTEFIENDIADRRTLYPSQIPMIDCYNKIIEV